VFHAEGFLIIDSQCLSSADSILDLQFKLACQINSSMNNGHIPDGRSSCVWQE
jgi:hypothetical protein